METTLLSAISALGVKIEAKEGARPVVQTLKLTSILAHVSLTKTMCEFLAHEYRDRDLFAVVGAGEDAVDASILAQWTAYALSTHSGREVLAVRASRKGVGIGVSVNSIPAEDLRKKKLLVVTDVLGTDTTMRLVVAELHKLGASVVGIVAIAEREGVTTQAPIGTTVNALFGIK